MLRTIGLVGAATSFAVGLMAASPALASNNAHYEVTITNLTFGQTLTPLIITTHRRGLQLFEPGTAASAQLEALAEEGDLVPLQELLTGTQGVHDVVNAVDVLGPPPASLLPPGDTVTHTIWGRSGARLTLAAMFIPTNDAFAALNAVRLPSRGRQVTYLGLAYDAGTEFNDQDCDSIPALCPGATDGAADQGVNASEGGVVHVHPGIHEVGDLSPARYDWRNPVIRVVIKRVR